MSACEDNENDRAAQAALDEALAAWNRAAQHWDPDALAATYAQDAVFFGGRPGHSLGRDGVRAYFASYAQLIRSARLQVQDHHLFPITPEVVLVQGYGCFDLALSDGKHARSVLRATLTLRRGSEGWRVLQHHFSSTPEAPPIGN